MLLLIEKKLDELEKKYDDISKKISDIEIKTRLKRINTPYFDKLKVIIRGY